MSKSAFLVYNLIAVHLQGSLTCDSTLSTQSTNEKRGNACDACATKLECTTRLDRMESQLAALQENLSSIEAVKEVPKVKKVENFVQIGSRFFYIEQSNTVNWFSGSNICRQMGGHLASPRSEEELNAIQVKLTKGRSYWLGISDLGNEGRFVSQATGNLAIFLKWYHDIRHTS